MNQRSRVIIALALSAGVLVAPAQGQELSFQLATASAETLSEPHDITLSPDGQLLYVADNGNDRIAVLDPISLDEVGSFGQGQVNAPHDVAFDGHRRLLVADTGNDRIAVFATNGPGGHLTGEIRGPIRRPEGVAVHPDGRVFATGAGSGNLVVFRDGIVVAEVGGFSAPHDVAFDANGGIWVADADNDRVVGLNAALAIVRVYSGPQYGFSGPRYLDFDSEGRMYVADKYRHRVKVIAPDGRLVAELGGNSSGKGAGLFDRPEGVAIRGDQAWFSDTYNNRIVRYRVDIRGW